MEIKCKEYSFSEEIKTSSIIPIAYEITKKLNLIS